MKVASKRSEKSSSSRATLTVSADTYLEIERLRDEQPRAAFVSRLVRAEADRQERQRFLEKLRTQYTDDVCSETLRINDSLPAHDR